MSYRSCTPHSSSTAQHREVTFQGAAFSCTFVSHHDIKAAFCFLDQPLRLVVVAIAQLKRDHPELALTAIDEVPWPKAFAGGYVVDGSDFGVVLKSYVRLAAYKLVTSAVKSDMTRRLGRAWRPIWVEPAHSRAPCVLHTPCPLIPVAGSPFRRSLHQWCGFSANLCAS